MNLQNICFNCMRNKPDDSDMCPYCGFENSKYEVPAEHLPPMTPLNGKYILGRAKGQGGFGITYIGYDLHLETKVAIKELFLKKKSVRRGRDVIVEPSRQAIFEENKKRFLQEARVLARFNETDSVGIVNVKEHFEENNTSYIVMEWLDGITLRDFVKRYGPLTFQNTIEMVEPVYCALESVHQQDVIHKDISPDNIMVLNDGRIKLLDFGGAVDINNREVDDIVSFKRGYAPPEQYQAGGVIGPWTDIYAFAATIYYCITRTKPVDAQKRQENYEMILKPSEMGIRIPEYSESVLLQALNLDPMERYGSVGEFWEELNTEKKESPPVLSVVIIVLLLAVLAGAIVIYFKSPAFSSRVGEAVREEVRFATRAAAMRAGCLNGSISHFARVCII